MTAFTAQALADQLNDLNTRFFARFFAPKRLEMVRLTRLIWPPGMSCEAAVREWLAVEGRRRTRRLDNETAKK